MRKYVFGVLILIVVLLISGPTGCQTTKESGAGPYVGGNDGLSIAFLDDAPTLSGNFQGEQIPLEVELINNGEQEIANGVAVVNLIGSIMGSSFTRSIDAGSVSNTGAIEKITDTTDVPDSAFVNIGNVILKDSEPIGPSWSPNIRVQVCYPYATYLQIDDLCIPGVRGETGTVECEIDNSKNLVNTGDVSGAPVQISSLVETKTGEGIRVRMDIENQGGGTVVKTGKPCNQATTVALEDKNLVNVAVPGGYSCVFKEGTGNVGVVELRDGMGRLRCTKPLTTSGRSYLDRFTATLTYNYVEETGKVITIQSKAI